MAYFNAILMFLIGALMLVLSVAAYREYSRQAVGGGNHVAFIILIVVAAVNFLISVVTILETFL